MTRFAALASCGRLDYVGWPVSWLAERLTSPDPIRKIRLGKIWAELRGVTAGPSGAQQAEIDNALTQVADERVPPLPKPWSHTVRAAVRSRADEIPAAVGAEIGAALPADSAVDRWWRVVGVVQGLLLGCALVGAAWLVALLILGVGGLGSASIPRLFTDPWYLTLGRGADRPRPRWRMADGQVLHAGCQLGSQPRDRLGLQDIDKRMAGVARDLVVAPAEQELAELEQFRTDLRIARGRRTTVARAGRRTTGRRADCAPPARRRLGGLSHDASEGSRLPSTGPRPHPVAMHRAARGRPRCGWPGHILVSQADGTGSLASAATHRRTGSRRAGL